MASSIDPVYVELHAHSYFSFLRAASSPEELVDAARALGYRALALTDHGGVHGAVRFAKACREAGIQPILGAELTLTGPLAPARGSARRDRPRGDASRQGGDGPATTAPRSAVPTTARATAAGDDEAASQPCIRCGRQPLVGAPEPVGDGGALHPRIRCEHRHLVDATAPAGGEEGPHLVVLVRDRTGWANLCHLLTVAGTHSPKGRPRLDPAALEGHTQGLIALSGCMDGEVARALGRGDMRAAAQAAGAGRDLFGKDAYWLEVFDHDHPDEEPVRRGMLDLGRTMGLGAVATNTVHYAGPADRPLADVLACIRAHATLDSAGAWLRPSTRFGLLPPAEMARRFALERDLLRSGLALARSIDFDLFATGCRLPALALPEGETAFSYLYELTHRGARARYGALRPAVARQIAHELDVIERLDLAGYFLVVWDVVRFARERGILVQGRGSAANSVVCFCLGITSVDPLRLNLLFERFLSEDRSGPPDIDLDIAHERREEVIQYVYATYGRDRAAMVAEVITYHARSALRDAGKVLGFTPDQVDRMARHVERHDTAVDGASLAAALGGDTYVHTPAPGRLELLASMCRRMEGVPRHLSIHVGGMVVSATPLASVAPIENATMPGRTVLPWDKDDVSDLGLVKLDLLGLGMLTLIDRAQRLLALKGVAFDPARLTCDESAVYDMLCAADTVGVFQVESRAQMNTLPRLAPRCFYDLVVEVALIRPGPIQGDMVHPYLRRRRGEEAVTYEHPCLEPILAKTLGVPLFQEQGMRVAVAAAGLSPGEADELRRAMGHKRSRAKMAALEARLHEGMARRGIAPDAARRIVAQLASFSSYGFPESHAASFALLVYASAHLKLHWPAAFAAALLDAQPMGFYSPATIVADARRHGVDVLPVDLAASDWDSTLEGDAVRGPLRLGLRQVSGLGETDGRRLVDARRRGRLARVEDVLDLGLSSTLLTRLATIGAFAGLGLGRREAVWRLQALLGRPRQGLLAEGLSPSSPALSPPPAAGPLPAPAHSRAYGFREHAAAGPGGSPPRPPPVAPPSPPLLPPPSSSASMPSPMPSPAVPPSAGLPLWPPAISDPLPVEEMGPVQAMVAEYRGTGLSTGTHPLAVLRATLAARGVVTSRRMVDLGRRGVRGKDARVGVAGLVISRQRPPTARGVLFLTLEDETGFANIVVRPRIVERFHSIVVQAALVLAEGMVESSGGAVNLLAHRFEALTLPGERVRFVSRDFR